MSSTLNLISNQDWKSAQSGQVVVLTDEERRTLIAEGYPIPQRFPLSKAEERSLKKIRRKIKNKISAQESRRKKKEYMEELEKKVSSMETRIFELEQENRLVREKLTRAEQLVKDRSADSGQKSSSAAASAAAAADSATDKQSGSVKQTDAIDSPRTTDKGLGDKNNDSSAQIIISSSSGSGSNNNPRRKDSTQTAPIGQQQQQPSDDDYFIDDILLSQERQEGRELVDVAEEDLVANLVGVVCASESDALVDGMVAVQDQRASNLLTIKAD